MHSKVDTKSIGELDITDTKLVKEDTILMQTKCQNNQWTNKDMQVRKMVECRVSNIGIAFFGNKLQEE